jgi:hypothetical protein
LRQSKDFLKIKPFTIEDVTLLKGLQVGRNKNSSNENTNKLSLLLENNFISYLKLTIPAVHDLIL